MVKIPPGFQRQLIIRGVVVWLLTRLAGLVVLAIWRAMVRDKAMLDSLTVHPVPTMVVAAALILVDLHRRKELMLLNNLGVATSHAVFIGSIPALVFESVRLVVT